MASRQERGRQAEEMAAAFLQDHGLKIVARNVRCPLGELDLVARDGPTVVFVEVRSRTADGRFGTPQESISTMKQVRLTRLARWYIARHGLGGQPARFDVVAILWCEGSPEISWIANAFEARDGAR